MMGVEVALVVRECRVGVGEEMGFGCVDWEP